MGRKAPPILGKEVTYHWLDKNPHQRKIKGIKKETKSLKQRKSDLKLEITRVKHDTEVPISDEQREETIHQLKKERDDLSKGIRKNKKKIQKHKGKIKQIDDRVEYGYQVDDMVNNAGLFRSMDDRYIRNGLFRQSVRDIGLMLNHLHPDWRKITSMVENVIGNLSMCICDPTVDMQNMSILFSNYILKLKPILEKIRPSMVVLYAKWLMLNRLNDANIIYDYDTILHSTKFADEYRRKIEGKPSFDHFVEFSKLQNNYMTPVQRYMYNQTQRIIRVMEENGMITCDSNKIKQRFRNGLRNLGVTSSQVGEIVHYAYDNALDKAQKYYAEKDPNMDPMFGYIRDISNFSPSYAGERYAMARL